MASRGLTDPSQETWPAAVPAQPQGWAPRHSAMLPSPGTTLIENPFYSTWPSYFHLPHLFCKAVQSKLCIGTTWQQQQSLTVTLSLLSKGQLCFYGCQTLLPSENFLIQWAQLCHPARVRDCFMGAAWEMHLFPSSWNTCCCHWKQDWLTHSNLDYLSTNCRGRADTELYSHFSVFSPFPSSLFYCLFWLFLYWTSGSSLFWQ